MTTKYELIKSINPVAAEIYRSRTQGLTNYSVLSKMYDVTPSQAKQLYCDALEWLINGDTRWLKGLSDRAKNQIKKTKYKDFESFSRDVLSDVIDLEDLPRVGHKLALEIRRWCYNNQNS